MADDQIRVLVVEDEVIIASALSVHLKALGYDVTDEVYSAPLVLESARRARPDMVLMDIQLNGQQSGIALGQTLQQDLGLPVVFTTAYADAGTLERAKQMQPYGYLLKPYDDSSLKVAIELAVYRHRIEQEQKILERQLIQSQKMEIIGQLTGGIAHDFNNLLSIIHSISEMLEYKPRLQPQLLEDLRGTVRRGTALIRQLMLFSRPKEPRLTSVDVGDALMGLRKLLHRLVGPTIRLVIQRPPEPVFGLLDPLLLDQLVMNLVANARDAMPDGGEVSISVARCDDDWLQLTVADSGEGISAEHIDQIFEPFFSTKAPEIGTGLGLSVVRRIVQGSNGTIEVRSRLREGTTFVVQLPLAECLTASSDQDEHSPREPDTSHRILVIDDDREVCEGVGMLLRSAGYDVTTAVGIGEAFSRVEEASEPFSMMLVDVMMPYMKGPELVSVLLRVHPTMRVGYVSGFTGTVQVDGPLLEKPFRRNRLLQFVSEVLADAGG